MPGVSVGVIQQFLHPPIGSLTNLLDTNGPYGPGSHTLTSWSDSGTTKAVGDTFGVIAIEVGAFPPGIGVQFGWDGGFGPLFTGDVYEERLLQICVVHTLLFGLGGEIITEVLEQRMIAQAHLWTEAIPGKLGLYVAPGLSFDLQFLQAL